MHFLSTVGDLCGQARIGQLMVAIKTRDGHVYSGIPTARQVPDNDPDALDDTGYADDLVINGERVRLRDVYTVRFWCP
jgi:hypothetical protein